MAFGSPYAPASVLVVQDPSDVTDSSGFHAPLLDDPDPVEEHGTLLVTHRLTRPDEVLDVAEDGVRTSEAHESHLARPVENRLPDHPPGPVFLNDPEGGSPSC